jgi:regulator of replication initiation timing
MQLPDFIKRAIAFFDKAEANLSAEQQVADLKKQIKELGEHNGRLVQETNAATVEIDRLKGELAKSQEQVNTKAGEIKTLQSALDAEKKKANETLAAQGLPAGTVPAAEPAASPGAATQDLLAQFENITDPRQRSEFIQKHSSAMLKLAQSRLKAGEK